MFDISGKEVFIEKEFLEKGEHLFQINTGLLKSGTYFINITNNDDIYYSKIIFKTC